MFDPPLSAALLARVVELEQRCGGLIIDRAKVNLELGLGALAARGIEAERFGDPDLVLVGTEEDADILIDERGWIWASAMGDSGEQAVSVDKYIERMAAKASEPWPGPYYTLFCDPRTDDVIRVLALTVDDIASDEVFTVARADAYQLWAQRRGTDWLTSRIKLRCRDFAALHGALSRFSAVLPDLCCAIASGYPGWTQSRVKRKDALQPSELEANILERSTARIGGTSGGAIHLLRDGGIEAYSLSARGQLKNHHQLTSAGGIYRELYDPA